MKGPQENSGRKTPAFDEPECPGPDCGYCNGEACANCGAGCWNNSLDLNCEHDVLERHQYRGIIIRGPGSTHYLE